MTQPRLTLIFPPIAAIYILIPVSQLEPRFPTKKEILSYMPREKKKTHT